MQKVPDREEKRHYIRLNTVFPIEFQLVSKEDRNPISELYEGFTRDIGKGGMGISAKVLKDRDREFFNFIPHETKLKVIINIPLDKESIESFATIEWIEKQPGPIIDTYFFGISYDFINELEYEKIVSYVNWLRLRPKLAIALIILLLAAFVFSLSAFLKTHREKIEGQRDLVRTTAEMEQAKETKAQAEKAKSDMAIELESAKKKQTTVEAAFEELAEEKKTLEEMSMLSEQAEEELRLELDKLAEEKALLEERIEGEAAEVEEEAGREAETPREEIAARISPERLEAEEANYNKFRQLILNEKIQSLSSYVSSHRSSIYHAAALFALADLRYKYREEALAAVSYNQVIELYPKSRYALYSSHRLGQLRMKDHYSRYTLKDFYDTYNLPELFDYRDIKPYIR